MDKSFLNIDLSVDYVDIVFDNEIEKNLEATEFYPILDTIIINMAKGNSDGKSINQKVTLLLNLFQNISRTLILLEIIIQFMI